jgi:ornithine cyclodeaminase/alanine dehydrogenase-like protein (mu-crystallin family)
MARTRILGLDGLAIVLADVGLTALLDQLIERLVAACDRFDPDITETFDRAGFRYDKPDLGLIEWMPAMEVGRRVSVKLVGYHPTNPVERGVPSVMSTTSLHDTTDGRMLALCESTFLTALRTGAASAVATDVLAAVDAATVGVVGCGAQAVTQVHAISRVRPVRRVLAFDANPDVARSLHHRLQFDDLGHGILVEVVDAEHVQRILGESDILVTATSVDIGAPAVLPDGDHQPWLHVNAVGADFPGKLELPESLVRRALVCPDVIAQCLAEGEAQRLDRDQLGPDLATLVRERLVWQHHRHGLTVFDSTGWALEDLVAAELVLDHAERLGAGVEVELQPMPTDPYDPYEFLRG